MNRKTAEHSASWLPALRLVVAMVVATCALAAAWPAWSQDEGEQQEEAKRTQAMSEKVYRKLAEAQEFTDKDDFNSAERVLNELKAEKLTPYETAQLYNFFGFVHFSQEKYTQAISDYKNVLNQPELPKGIRDQTIYTLAQLYFTTENWAGARDQLQQYLKEVENPPPDPYILLGSAYYQLDNYKAMIEPIETAMKIARERDVPVKEQWWLLLRVAYYEQENYAKVRDILQVLVVNWPKKEYWTTLAAIYGELNDEKRQLAAYESAYDQGFLTNSNELVQLAQLFLQAEVPYKAAKVLEKGLADGNVEKTADNYRLLSQAWQLAANDEKAVPALKTAASMSRDGELDVRLANSYLNLSRYDECVDAARSGLSKGGVRREDNAQVVLGMCLYELEQYEEAKKAFRLAANDKRSASTATQWINFIEREQERQRQLEQSLQQVRRASS